MGIEKPPKRSVKTVNTMFGIVGFLLETGGSGVTEIAESQGLAESTVHSHLATLLNHEYVVKDGTTYRLGLKFLNHGVLVKDALPLSQAGDPVIRQISEETGEVAWIVVEEHGRAVYLMKSSGENAVQTRGHVGKRTTMHDIAAGKAILANLPGSTIDDIVDAYGLPKRTENTITDRDELNEELETIREQGYAINNGETIGKVRAVASPILAKEKVQGSVGIAGPKHRMSGERLTETLSAKVLEAADTIELELEYQ